VALSLDTLPAGELVQFCQLLVQTPSVNGQHPERAVAEHVAQFAHRHGIAAEIAGQHPERPNVILRAGPPGETSLLLVAHTDTVAAGNPGDWAYPPFGGVVHDGKLYGRGAIDTKGGLVAGLAALLLLRDAEPGLRRPVTLIGVPDEESGATGVLGVRYLHEQGLLGGRGAIYTYPGMHEIVVGHRGVLRITLTAHGTAFHSGSREWQDAAIGHNAVTGLAEILLALEQLRFPGKGAEGLFAPYRTVLTPTTISGGVGPSSVPASCSAHVDIRLVPGVERAEVEAAIRRAVDTVVARRPPLRVKIETSVAIPATQIAPDTAIVASVQAAAREVTGNSPPLAVSGPANESYILNGYGIPTCIFGPEGGRAHAADEYVVIDSIFQAARVYALAALKLSR
jgi:acetylornithine deacetylase/succinyl-diaminopimelate desuccinylase-like protein